MSVFSFARCPLVNINRRWNESKIGHEGFVRLLDHGVAEVLKVHELSLIITNGVRLFIALFLTTVYHVVFGGKVPNDNLAIKAATHKHVRVIWVPLNGRYLDRCVQQVRQRYYVIILKIEHKQLRIKRFTLNHSPGVEVHVVDHTHGNQVGPRGVKLDAGDSLVLAVITIQERPRLHRRRIDLAALSRLIISEHLEVVLEYIDDFVRLQCSLNLKSDPINKLIKLILMKFRLLQVFLGHLLDLLLLLLLKVRRIIHC